MNAVLSNRCSCSKTTETPGGGLGIYTDRDQRSIFGGFEFRKSVFLGGTGQSCCIFFGGGVIK